MNDPIPLDLIEMFRAFLSHYPSMRFGQAVCAIASWENDDPMGVSDASFVASLRENLERRFEGEAYEVMNSSMSDDLATALKDARRLTPTVSLGQLIVSLAIKHNWNIYDMENDDLMRALQAEISGTLNKPPRGQPITA